ncbi:MULTISPECIES: Rho-binding antiterminator [Pseudomonas]|uniref:Transcriptional antiterminator n=1 Tax=Pseudomonas gessardii TaxID=78544 RepID=A0A7Y1MJW8_9PSED|nr:MULTISPECIES: Rho-binding antiterminator [Pseudomonas]MBH3423455.1 Rho-binding antiterminator [Pseudomonas gessardii]MCF4980204.1 transcriptional antiterminator [Pseudomonas gessardii]MCF4989875.1 transcriptional antiterminator [Pseudomonas gessardii]MCF5085567.1 transcriptional antiterminator [Pseudomonas gessardii]MCF5094971.1 transcriptional antiterminator [Pseudomonas gessardii]
MNAYQPLHCDLHDYLEIACLYRYRLLIETVDGRTFAARALTTRTAASKEEFLVLHRDDEPVELRLDQLLAITALEPHASFGRIELAGSHCAV